MPDEIHPKTINAVGFTGELLLNMIMRAVAACFGPNHKVALIIARHGDDETLAIVSDIEKEDDLVSLFKKGADKIASGTLIDCTKGKT